LKMVITLDNFNKNCIFCANEKNSTEEGAAKKYESVFLKSESIFRSTNSSGCI
jgi:hypothetical protein